MNRMFAGLVLAAVVAFAGCQESKVSPTKGHIIAEVDQSIAPIVMKEKVAFDSLYIQAKVDLKIVPPLEGMVDLLNGKVKMFVTTRYLNKQEIDFINKQKLDVRTFKFCYNAVVLISSKQNKIKQLRVDEIKDVMLGRTSDVSFMIPQNNSETYLYLKEELLNGADPKNCEIVFNEADIIKRIQKGSDKIGIVSFNLIQDSSKINFLELGELGKNTDSAKSKNLEVNYFSPHPGYVLKDYYPFKQTIYIYLNEKEMTPASGFTTFLTSYEGQKIALGENLAPAAVPVKINTFQ